MVLRGINIENFRNYDSQSFSFGEGVNLICGENAQGKTNILEAIFFFSSLKSFRSVKDIELIRNNQDLSKIKIEFFCQKRENSAQIKFFKEKRKEIYLNDIKINKNAEFIGAFKCILFSPEDLSIVKQGPANRRTFLDMLICQLRPKYFTYLKLHNKIIEQKNALLKNHYFFDNGTTLDILNSKLSEILFYIVTNRQNYLDLLCDIAKQEHLKISEDREVLNISSKSLFNLCGENGGKEAIFEILSAMKQKELSCGMCLAGAHRDDFEIELNGKNVKTYGSQGQQRSVVLNLKMSACELIKREFGEYPVILLDDIMSELDIKRQEYIINNIKDKQVFITCCEREKFKKLKEGKVFLIDSGSLKKDYDI